MSKRCTLTCILALAGIGGVSFTARSGRTAKPAIPSATHARALAEIRPSQSQYFTANRLSQVAHGNEAPSSKSHCSILGRCVAPLAIPMTFEPNVGQFDPRVKFVGRGAGMTLLLTRKGIDVEVADRGSPGAAGGIRTVRMSVEWAARLNKSTAKVSFDRSRLAWHAAGRVKTVSNYFLGRNREAWRTSVPHFARAVAASSPKERVVVDAYGSNDGVEFDLRLAPGTDASKLRLRFAGAARVQLSGGDLLMLAGHRALRMKAPRVYQELPGRNRKIVPGRYVMQADGSVGLKLGPYNARAAVVIDPSISVSYATFLGGAGAETAGNIAMDAAGKIYVGGSTTSASTFPEASAAEIGTVVSSSALFVAKIDPTINGANSLLYLTFLGGSGVQTGGIIAVDGAGDVAITGTTTSVDFPVTGSSQPTNGLTSGDGNDVVVSEIDPTGGSLDFSSYFGGSGKESENGAGGIALDGAGNVYVASDTNTTSVDPTSADLPVTSGAYQTAWDAQASDGFLAVFAPPAQPGNASTLTYCSYLGTNSTGPVIIGGIAVDSLGNAYIAGSTSNASIAFPSQNAFQSAFGGGASDGFVMKISPAGQGAGDLAFATLIGGSGMDEALGIALDSSVAPRVYVTGETQSADFPVDGANAPYQSKLRANPLTSDSSNAFLTVIAQDAVSAATSLTYSTYLGGSGADAGLAVAVAAPGTIYVAGQTDSADFPWHDNLQPFNGQVDAFVAKFDPTSSGAASFIYATPLAGTSPPGETVSAAATGVASNGSGQLYLTGQTTAADFPTAITTQSAAGGFQQTCASCQAASPSADAFVVAIAESQSQGPSVYFNASSLTFAASSIGSPNLAQLAAVLNGGEQTLTISDMQILGPNASDFSLQGQGPCLETAIAPGSSPQCSFEVNFTPSISGPETALVAVSDNAPGSPQLLELRGAGQGPHAMIVPLSVNFGSQPLNTVSNGRAITIKNSGNQSLTLARESGPGTAQFQLQGGSCQFNNWLLAAGASCTLEIVFSPSTTGSLPDQIQIWDNSDLQANSEQIVSLAGVGASAAPIARIEPSSMALEFGSIAVGNASGAQTVTLNNQGSAALSITGIAVGGTNAQDFAIQSSGTMCPITGGTLAIGASCTVAIQFVPQTSGASKTASLTFSDNAAGSPQQVALTGAATNPVTLQVSPANLLFQAQSEGTASGPQTVTITNSGSAAAGISGVSLTGANAADFNEQSSCSPVVDAGNHCQISVAFDPSVLSLPGLRAAALSIAGGTPSSVALSGTATRAAISLPTSVAFATQLAGTAGAPQPVTVTNSSSGAYAGALSFAGISVAGPNNSDFGITANGCATSGNAPVAPGNSCAIQVAFQPTEGATCGENPNRSAMLTLADNAPGSPQTLSLSGTASDFCFALLSGQPAATPIQPGQPATYSLEVNSYGGFTGMVGLTCSTSPAGLGSCAVNSSPASNPPAVQVGPGAPGQFTVTVPTLAAGALPPHAFGSPPTPKGSGELTAILAACALCLLLIGRLPIRRGGAVASKADWSILHLIQVMALLLGLGAGLVACSGGGNDSPPALGTPPGTYTITLVAATTSGTTSTSRTATLTLTVN